MAGAEPAAPLAARVGRLVAERDAAEMGADADDDQPLIMAGLDPVGVGLRLDEVAELDVLRRLDFDRRAVADKDRLAAPDRGDRAALGDRRQINLGGLERQHVRGRVHAVDKGPGDGADPDGGGGAHHQGEKIALGYLAGAVAQG